MSWRKQGRIIRAAGSGFRGGHGCEEVTFAPVGSAKAESSYTKMLPAHLPCVLSPHFPQPLGPTFLPRAP